MNTLVKESWSYDRSKDQVMMIRQGKTLNGESRTVTVIWGRDSHGIMQPIKKQISIC